MPPEVPSSNLVFHHLGLACRDFSAEKKALEALGYQPEGPVYDDPGLGIHCCFLAPPPTSGTLAPRIELITPMPNSTVLDPWLNQGVKIYHLAFFTPDLAQELNRLQALRGKIVTPPTPAVAFGGKRISFVMLPNMLLAEFIENPPG